MTTPGVAPPDDDERHDDLCCAIWAAIDKFEGDHTPVTPMEVLRVIEGMRYAVTEMMLHQAGLGPRR